MLWAFSFPSTNEAPGAVQRHGVGRPCLRGRGWEVTSLDSNPKARPMRHPAVGLQGLRARALRHGVGLPLLHRVQHRPQEAAPQPAGRGRPGAQDVRDHRLPQAQVVGHREPEHRAPQNSPLHARAAHGQGHVLQVRLPLQEAHGGTTCPGRPPMAPAARATAARPSTAPGTPRPRSEGPPKGGRGATRGTSSTPSRPRCATRSPRAQRLG